MNAHQSDADVLAQYVAAFEKLDTLCTLKVPAELLTRTDGSWKWWRPLPHSTQPSALDALYRRLGLLGSGSSQFPRLYELLILSYRWAEVDLCNYRLLANKPSEDLAPLRSAMTADRHLRTVLLPNGYIQFGKGPDINYDPVCFDFRRRQNNGDCPIVMLDHEAILCYDRIEEKQELAPNFRTLVHDTIHRAALKQAARPDPTNGQLR